MINLALAMIVKGSDSEALALKRALRSIAPHVDGIFVTITQPNKKVEQVANLFGAEISHFKWCNNFAKARNFNFAQVPKEYTHILWADADDIFRGLEKLKETIKENEIIDAFSMFYLYAFDEHKRPITVHQKTQILKNNGCVQWEGRIHEDFKENRNTRRMFIKGIERLHITDEDRIEKSRVRNAEIAKLSAKQKPNDPRSYWNLGNALYSTGEHDKSKEALLNFMSMSSSEEEKYVALLRLSVVDEALGNTIHAKEHLQQAIGLRVEYPDAFHMMGGLLLRLKEYDRAIEYYLQGLVKKPPYFKIIAYNPRDYDYNPMMNLSRCFIFMDRPDQALIMMEACEKIYPRDDSLKRIILEMKKEKKVFDKMIKVIPKLEKIKDKDKLKDALDKLPEELQSHPRVCHLRNTNFIKNESSGKDLVLYCGPTEHVWNPDLFKVKGYGGSEEAVVNLSEKFSKLGWNVTVYANCGLDETYGDVKWKPFWSWNYRDKQDIVVLWRHPQPVDYGINAKKICLDMHDMLNVGEFTPERLEKIDHIFFKTNFHRSVYPMVPDEKAVVIPNGMDFELFNQKVKKEQYLLVNTSSPDRSLDVLPKLFKEVKKQVPKAKLEWAYGWDVFDAVHRDDPKVMKWKADVVENMKKAGVKELGRVTQKEAVKLYLRANILAYPTEFAEIDCITVKKAQACACLPITTDFAALEESVQHGIKIHSDKTKDTWTEDFKFAYGLEDKEKQKQWVDEVVKVLNTPIENREEMQKWTERFNWGIISKQWNKILTE